MSEKDFSDIIVAIIIFVISASDFYKGILLAFTEKVPLLFMAQIGFWILKFLPTPIREQRRQEAMNAYTKRRKWNGV